MEKYAISVDWLEVFTLRVGTNPYHGLQFEHKFKKYEVKRLDGETAVFMERYEITSENISIATFACVPRSPKLKQNMCIIKLSNRVLYMQGYIDILYSIMRALEVQYIGVTRVDLCYDCIRYHDAKKPQDFVNDFLASFAGYDVKNKEYQSMEQKYRGSFYIRGKKVSGKNKVNYIRFGEATSRCHSYIYDKSLELTEVKDKPWIREFWKENGIEPTSTDHVWRSEISIKGTGKDILNMRTGELFQLSPQYMQNQQSIEALFAIYAEKYFSFVGGDQKNKRFKKHIKLFEYSEEITCKPITLCKKADCGKSEKMCANTLIKLSETYVDISSESVTAIRGAINFINQIAGLKRTAYKHESRAQYLSTMLSNKFINDEMKRIAAAVANERSTYIAVSDFMNRVPSKADLIGLDYDRVQQKNAQSLYEYTEYAKRMQSNTDL